LTIDSSINCDGDGLEVLVMPELEGTARSPDLLTPVDMPSPPQPQTNPNNSEAESSDAIGPEYERADIEKLLTRIAPESP